MPTQRLLCLIAATLFAATALTGCGSEDIPPGNKGFMFDRTGALAFYAGGNGLLTDDMLGPGTHFTGLYDEVRDVDCKDASAKEIVDTLTKSDLTVSVDVRITYSADCTSKEKLIQIIDQVQDADGTVDPEALYDRYILPVVRASLRNRMASVTIEDVKVVRQEITKGILDDLRAAIAEDNHPVLIKVLQVSNIILPVEITEKNKMIELARQEAEQEREKQSAATVRLERELFEAQQERKVQVEQAKKENEVAQIDAERDKQIAILQAEAQLEREKKEAEGIAVLRAELTPQYMQYLQLLKGAEVQNNMAAAMSNGTVFYIDKDFVVPPGSSKSIAISP